MNEATASTAKTSPQSEAVVKASPEVEVIHVDDQHVSKAVHHINEIWSQTVEVGSKGLLQIGEYILKEFFAGKEDEVRSRNPHKDESVRALSNHPDLLIKPTSLSNAVNLALQERDFADAGVSTEGISVTHRIVLIPVREVMAKIRLLNEVREKKFSADRLRLRISELKQIGTGQEKSQADVSETATSPETYSPADEPQQPADSVREAPTKGFTVKEFMAELERLNINRWLRTSAADIKPDEAKTLQVTVSQIIKRLMVVKKHLAAVAGHK